MKFKYAGKKIAVVGLGIEGISSARYLAEHGAKISVRDQKELAELPQETVKELKRLGVEFETGKKYLENLSDFDFIVRAPGIRPDLPPLKNAVNRGSTLTSHTQIFFDLCQSNIIGVTGTKGKGTTSTLIKLMLEAAGKKAFLGGNIGEPPLDFLDETKPGNWVILELSSFQLIDLQTSPHIAVVLMVTSEHLDWHTSTNEYQQAKYNIVSHQTERDFAVINTDYRNSVVFAKETKAEKVWVSLTSEEDPGVFVKDDKIWRWFKGKYEEVINTNEVRLPGQHNLENACAAVAAASIVGVSAAVIRNTLKEFPGLEHRLELVREWKDKIFYNDSFSTTPETAIAALRSFTKPMSVILGGSSKNSDYTELGTEVVNNPHLVNAVLIGKTAGEIRKAIKQAGKPKAKLINGKGKFEEIVKLATQVTPKGGIVLLSPACASFDMFENYKQRGLEFKKIVNNF
ncbi:MAG: UDP-N-acetylmuramoylalanine--D-glutamate ligase [Candidatus Woykebacteria bacterium RIFCSPHIGHO2_12_FULL_45_10]|uniref:UDP-N-acetylmuramoylalanine--D-glutamate ligase n=1 Tax=Candidatus Woykebacteria bacterium RIFCSPHIGHO2_12_FULL_45_10 TaxID=1802603 RepID=A0A1G1WMI5_9BACT|nr:MAG: UDP-N-acetylmuramoylalanine--D-glutamate ligase [Candidatus Woykebacteria bacterium RIFCSPHIGHO2_12_FULL_45_10]